MAGPLDIHNIGDDGAILSIPGKGIILAAGDTVPTDGQVGYSPGCIFIDTDASSMNTTTYTNIGTEASCNFDAQVNA
jgi:hypothetical protein